MHPYSVQFQFIYAGCIAHYINIWSFDPFLHRVYSNAASDETENSKRNNSDNSLNGLAPEIEERNTDMHPQV